MNISQRGECTTHSGFVSTEIINDDVEIQMIATLAADQDIDTPSPSDPKLQVCLLQRHCDFQDIAKAHRWLKWRPKRLYASLELRVAHVGIDELNES